VSEARYTVVMRGDWEHCEALVRAADKDRYLTALFLPPEIRPHALALYAFNIEVAATRERANEPLAGEVRLQWWRDVMADNAAGGVAGNPVAAAFAASIDRYRLPLATIERLIEAREFDLYDDPMPSMAAFEAYVRLTSASLFELVGEMLGGTDAAFASAASHAGSAYGIVGLLRALPMHASRGQIYIPLDLLARHQVTPESIRSGESSPQLKNALKELRDKAREHYRELNRLLPSLPNAVQPVFLPLVLTDAYLALMERRSYDPFTTPVELSQVGRQWKLWRSARRAP
jgi:phytoene synthase